LTDPQEIKREILKLRLLLKRRIDPTSHCWIWTGTHDNCGRGLIKVGQTRVSVHRVAWSLFRGRPLKRNELALQTCGNYACFFPGHIEVRTWKSIMKAGWDTRRKNFLGGEKHAVRKSQNGEAE